MIFVLMVAIIYSIACGLINFPWLNDLSGLFGYQIGVYIIAFLAIVPGFFYVFNLLNILFHKNPLPIKPDIYPDITVIIPAYNAEKQVEACVNSVLASKYDGQIFIIFVNDGSTDSTYDVIENKFKDRITILNLEHKGKCFALNEALKKVSTKYFITVDSDTIILPNSIQNIVGKILEEPYAAVAGTMLIKNSTSSFLTKIQAWDYSLGIFCVKLVQSFFKSTLVTQGAFSIYRTDVVHELGGWQNCIGEDIVLTWGMLKKGYHTSFSPYSIALTTVPETLSHLVKQRKRWARGMIEAFKRNRGILYAPNTPGNSRILLVFNIFFPFVDLALTIFLNFGFILLLFGNYLIVGPLFLCLIPLTLLMNALLNWKFKRAMMLAGHRYAIRHLNAFIIYILFFQLILAPFCFIGCIQEFLYYKKTW
ncbi:MAG: glycosyltransferase [Bacillota bacterium]|nr:glycosyltransferase [Bacillota bacterium]